jgi:predicted porin
MKKYALAPLALYFPALLANQVALAQSVTVYGLIDLGLVHQNQPDIGFPFLVGTALKSGAPNTVISDGAGFGSALGSNGLKGSGWNVAQGARSKLGFKGSEPLGNGLTARFDLEHRFYPDTGGIDKKENVFWDKAVVGITSTTWGDVALGRDYMPAFYPQAILDPWLNEGVAQMGGNLYAFSGYFNDYTRFARYNNGIYYRMQAGGFAGMLAMSFKEDGGSGLTKMFKNRWGFNAMYSSGPWYVGMGYDTSVVLEAGKQEHLMLAGASYDAGVIKTSLSLSQSKVFAAGDLKILGHPSLGINKTTLKPSSWTLAASVPAPSGMFKMGITRLKWDDASSTHAETSQHKWSVGYEHTLSKRTALYADFTRGRAANLPAIQAWDMGIKHKF